MGPRAARPMKNARYQGDPTGVLRQPLRATRRGTGQEASGPVSLFASNIHPTHKTPIMTTEYIGMTRDSIDTPVLLVDLDALEYNIARLAEHFYTAGKNLRPHIKSHKTPAIAHLQLSAGAQGITCAKVGEAEVMADAGVQDILIANEVVGRRKIERLMALARSLRHYGCSR